MIQSPYQDRNLARLSERNVGIQKRCVAGQIKHKVLYFNKLSVLPLSVAHVKDLGFGGRVRL
jgi:hypothetical protein